MIAVAGTITFEPAHRAAAHGAFEAVMNATAELDDGYIAYRITADLTDPGTVHIFEIWETEAHFDAHQAAPHSQAMLAALGPIGVSRVLMTRYEATEPVTLFDI